MNANRPGTPQDFIRRFHPVLTSTLIMAAIAAVLFALVWSRGGTQAALQGGTVGLRRMVQVLPLLVFAFLATGLIESLIPRDLFARWVGSESGYRGIMLGSLAGAIAPGGPLVQAGIAAGFLKGGAALAPVVAFLVAGEMWGFTLIPIEVGLLGWKVYLTRLACTFFVPPMAGLLTHWLVDRAAPAAGLG